MTYHPENHKNILIVSELDETFLGHWISQEKFNGIVCFVIRDLENFLSSLNYSGNYYYYYYFDIFS